MIGRLVILLCVISFIHWQIDGACYIYNCDDQESAAKCVNSTDYWVTKSNLNDKKYCECCQNPIIRPDNVGNFSNVRILNETAFFNKTANKSTNVSDIF